MKLATATEMQQLDRLAIEKYHIPGIVLMENAGHGTVSFMEKELGSLQGTTVAIFVGPGNNGGDGLVIARRIIQANGNPLLFFATSPEKLLGDAAINYTIIQKMGLPFYTLDKSFSPEMVLQEILSHHARLPVSCLVDSLFGTGLAREISGHFAQVISLINLLRATYSWPVISVDLPSGLDADTGQVLGCAVQADYTATYGLAKPAHYQNGGNRIGLLHLVDIGIPQAAIEQSGLAGAAITQLNKRELPTRKTDSHKGSHGHLFVLAGSEGKTGAAILSCQAALQSGCGLVTAAVPFELNPIFEQNLIEAMTLPLPNSMTFLSAQDFEIITSFSQDKNGIVLGPGIGTENDTSTLVRRLYQELPQPMVVDADALNILAQYQDVLATPGGPRILTPHPGEMSRLTGLSIEEVQTDRIGAAQTLCGKNSLIITVLKGAGTVIAQHDKWAINTSGNHGMATGGMGDVLSGLIGSLLVQGSSPWAAACSGVYLHGLSADILACQSAYGYLASTVALTLPQAIHHVQTKGSLKNNLVEIRGQSNID